MNVVSSVRLSFAVSQNESLSWRTAVLVVPVSEKCEPVMPVCLKVSRHVYLAQASSAGANDIAVTVISDQC